MKVNLPRASQIKRRQVIGRAVKETSIRKVAFTFMNGKLKEAINEAIVYESADTARTTVNVEVPIEAYSNEEFYTICIAELKKLGYKASKSHDGGGMYSTLCVSWAWQI